MDVFKIVRYVFGGVGVLLLIITMFLVQNTRSFLADAVSAQGTVLNLLETRSSSDSGTSYSYAPVVRFTTAEGQQVTFTSSVSSSPPSYHVGETVEVLYSADQPQRARIHDWFSLWGAATIVGGLGVVFSAVGGGLAYAGLRSRRKTRPRVELVSTGALVEADVQRVEPADTFSDNGSQYRIVAQWLNPDTHEMHIFTSEEIPFDPTSQLGKTVKVYIAPHDPQQHYMDISFLPKLAH